MPYITVKVISPTPDFKLNKEVNFTRFQITDITFEQNALAAGVEALLISMDRFNINHFLNDVNHSNGLPTNRLSSNILLALPVIPNSIYTYSPISGFPFLYHNKEDPQKLRDINLRFSGHDNITLTTAQWGATKMSITFYFE